LPRAVVQFAFGELLEVDIGGWLVEAVWFPWADCRTERSALGCCVPDTQLPGPGQSLRRQDGQARRLQRRRH